MSEAKHTPGPWEVFGDDEIKTIYGSPGMDKSQLVPAHVTTGINQKANAARIVACVNGCEGINPEAVGDLLAALHDLVTENDDYAGCPVSSPAWNTARAAIAKATGEEVST